MIVDCLIIKHHQIQIATTGIPADVTLPPELQWLYRAGRFLAFVGTLYGAYEVEIGKQWTNNKLLTSLSKQKEFLGCLRRNNFVTVLFKQMSDTVPGDFLGRLVLGVEDDKVKVFGATIF